jgi:integrase
MPLTDTAIRNAKPREKPYKLFDERGLFMLVTPTGGKWWRFRYKFDDKEKLLSLGTYPDVPLASQIRKDDETGSTRKIKGARELRDDARELVAQGVDPGVNRKVMKSARVERAANSFEAVAREWFAKNKSTWVEAHSDRIIRRFERDIFPWIGGNAIADLTPPELLTVLRKIEERGAIETAHRALSNCSQVFCYAVATSRATSDPTRDLRRALPPPKAEHFAAVTDPKQVGKLLVVLDGYEGTPVVGAALRLAPLVFVRPGELRKALWEEIDLDSAEWRFTVTKTKTPHIVALSTQAVAILKDLKKLTGHGKFVFPGARTNGRPMSDNAVLAAMRRLGIPKEEMSGHGFRAMARTILDEVMGFRIDFIEHQLAHAVKDPNGRSYNRTAHLKERQKMMQAWADYLDQLKSAQPDLS